MRAVSTHSGTFRLCALTSKSKACLSPDEVNASVERFSQQPSNEVQA